MNRENLEILANHLINLPKDYKHFHMENFCVDSCFYQNPEEEYELHDCHKNPDNTEVAALTSCNTVACALGHGPAAGIANKVQCLSWWNYGRVYFIDDDKEASEWDWCFSNDWALVDNTAQGAGKRIKWLLDQGLPKNCHMQKSGKSKLCYEEES